MKDAKAALKRAETLAAPSTTKKSAPKNRRVVTRYMGSGIRDQGSESRDRDQRPRIPRHKSWDQDQPFFVCVFEGSGIELFRYFIINEKLEYFVLQAKRPLFMSIEKA